MDKKRRQKQTYVPYDYEAAYEKQLLALEEDNIKKMLESGRVRSIYAAKEIRAGNQLEVEIYPEFARGQVKDIPPEGRRKKNRQAQRNLNEKNSRKMCERTINANFTDRDIWATFTYTDEDMPKDIKEAQRNMQNYIRRLNYQRKKMGLPNTKYVYVTECTEEGRWHHHIVLDGDVSMDLVEEIWTKGFRNEVKRLERDKNGLTGMAKYITKQKKHTKGKKKGQPLQDGDGKYMKTWTPSKGLKKPEEKKNHYKFKQKDVDDIVRGKNTVEEKMLRWYAPEYEFTEFEVRYNDWNGRFYIYARLYKPIENRRKKVKKE